ncbi:MAG TPA: hypothetical protein VN259_17220 [Xanthomonadales bacterium]|nr:hypothetical protein [Xanthomonadales bacterium]
MRLIAWLAGLVRDPLARVLHPLTPYETGLAAMTEPWASKLVCVQLSREGEVDSCQFGDDWHRDAMVLALRQVGVAADVNDDYEALMDRLGQAYGQSDFVKELLDRYGEGDQIGVDVQVEMAMRFSGEHNLRAAMIQTGYHSDRMRLWGFGGYNDLVVRKNDGSVQTHSFAPQCEMVSALERFCRESLMAEQAPAASAPATPGQKLVIAQLFSTQPHGHAPVFASFAASEGMVEHLCKMRDLADANELDVVKFACRTGFEFCTDDPSGGMDRDAVEQWAVTAHGECWIEGWAQAGNLMGNLIQTRAMQIGDLQRALASDSPVFVVQQTSASGGEFLTEVAATMLERTESGDQDWSEELASVVETLCQIDPERSEEHREFLVAPASTTERARS